MLLDIEIMTTQRNVERVNVEDLTKVAIQRCSLKKVFFKESTILKTTCLYIHFLKSAKRKWKVEKPKACNLAKVTLSEFFH